MNGVPVRSASASCSCSQVLLKRHMADWAPPDAHNRESSSNSLKKFRALVGSILVGDTGDVEPVAGHHAVNLLVEDIAVNDTWLSEPWYSQKLFFNMSSTNSPLSLSSANFEVDIMQRAAMIVEEGPSVKTFLRFFRRSLTSTLPSECPRREGPRCLSATGRVRRRRQQIRCRCGTKHARCSCTWQTSWPVAVGDVPWCAAPPRSLACLRRRPWLIHC